MKHIFDDNDKNKYEALSKAEVIALLQQVVESGELPENILEGISLTLRNPIDNQDYKIAFCTQAKYNELKAAGQIIPNCLYYIIDDNSYEDINISLENIRKEQKNINDTLEDKHLYMHSIEIIGPDITIGSTYSCRVYLTLYCKEKSKFLTISDLVNALDKFSVSANGYVMDSQVPNDTYPVITLANSGLSIDEKRLIVSFIKLVAVSDQHTGVMILNSDNQDTYFSDRVTTIF